MDSSEKEKIFNLLKHLRDMTADLPDDELSAFMQNENRLKLELLIEALEGKTDLFRKIASMAGD